MIGKTLAQYEILDEVSRGGMGVVYRARDVRLGREVALKVLPADLIGDSHRRTRFEREARAAAALEHPSIGLIYGLQEDQGVGFIVMELIRGRSLKEVLEADDLDRAQALELAIEIADGLAHAHDRKIVHRDLKPANIMVTAEGRAKIIDFGLAKLADPSAMEASWLPTQLHGETASGVILGTPSYMSPEQARGESADTRSDIFSFGVVAYEMLARRRPFAGGNAADVVSAILRDPMPPLEATAAAGDEVTAGLEEVLSRCLAKRPDDRYASMQEVAADLRALRYRDHTLSISGIGIRPRAPGAPAPTPAARARWHVPLAVAIGVAALTAAWFGGWRGGTRPGDAVVAGREASVAVLGFRNLTGRPDAEWLSTAFAEMLRTELSAGSGVRVIAGETVARARLELGLGDQESFAADTLTTLRDNLGSDFVVVGGYTVLGAGSGGQIRFDLRLQDAVTGETVVSVATTGVESDLFDLVNRAGGELRAGLGVGALTADEILTAQAAQARSPEAARAYAEGLEQLRHFDAMGATESLQRAVDLDPSFALGHAALSQAWTDIGFEVRAAEAARKAYEMGGNLSREQYLLIEARHHAASGDWQRAAATFQALWALQPDEIEYGLRLAEAQTRAGVPQDALATVQEMRGLTVDGEEDPRIDLAEARAADALSDYARELAAVDRVVAAAESRGAWTTIAEARLLQGAALIRFGQPSQARAHLEEARSLFERAGNRARAAEAVNQLAILERQSGRLDAAETLYRESLRMAGETGNRALSAFVLNNIALIVWERGDLASSEALLAESVTQARESGDRALEANSLDSLSSILLDQGRVDDAERTAREGLAIARDAGERSVMGWLLRSIGQAAHERGRVVEAETSYREAEALTEQTGYRHLQAYVLESRARLAVDRGELDQAEALLTRANDIRRELGNPTAEGQLELAWLRFEEGDLEAALTLAQQAESEFARDEMTDALATAAALRARIHVDRGDFSRAEEAIQAAVVRLQTTQSALVRLELETAAGVVAGATDAALGRQRLARVAEQARGLGLAVIEADAAYEAARLAPEAARAAELEQVAARAEANGLGLVARKARAAAAGA